LKPFQLGLIEGFYGQAWSWQTRREYAAFLAQAGYSFYFYAPKSDPYFRKKWREPLPRDLYDNLESLVDYFHRSHLEFGVGLSPYEIYMSFDSDTKKQLFSRIEILNSLKVDRLAVLFDDMKGDCPTLAQTQVDILHWVREHSTAKHLIVCPTYYSSDPILKNFLAHSQRATSRNSVKN
jgi:hyaluronoglucosaminidase